ncbi:glutamate synthase large subunit [Marinihelvus fidelis]|uniref:Glutamate synthase [NADPH] large chain n=1 Tax=Marinihelvus fidelis TaxID=2613842 RepID=A0A5N0T900_9GAMM|nr:glutamate synthase large subunit [Marinihelvus fidelis]KAA9131430.1 glutamate synthase large subunit [Marinihelvus fidelis]
MQWPGEHKGLYQPLNAKDSCGFGLIAHIHGEASHRLVETACKALDRMTHRGAVAVDGKTGDGCGVLMALPRAFFREVAKEDGIWLGENFAVGMVFLDRDPEVAARSRAIVEKHITDETLEVAGWREVPLDTSVLGQMAANTLPRIEQVLVNAPPGWGPHDIERRLFIARRLASAENAALESPDPRFHVATLSNLVTVYKGLVMPANLPEFFPDLKDERLKSSICVFHQRFSTNTLPNWKYAQPFRFLAHNGEINTIEGNRSWAEARTPKFQTPLLPDLQRIRPLVNQEGSDSSSLDNMLELFLAGGMDVFRAMRILVPPAWQAEPDMPADLKAFYEFNSMHVEPWDGPAGIVMTNGTVASCNLDRNGLRPARYVITRDDLVTLASEVGVWDYAEADVIEKGRVGPGEMFAIDTSTGKLWRSDEIDNQLKARRPYADWLAENIIRLANNDDQEAAAAEQFMADGLKRLPVFQKLYGVSNEEREHVIRVMAEDQVEATGSMGDDTPVAVMSRLPRSIYDYFRQQFAQVTNPPIDPLREKSAMSLETIFGREHNIFQETNTHAHRVVIPWPVLNIVKFRKLMELDPRWYANETFSINYPADEGLEAALHRLCDEVSESVRAGTVIVVLTDRDIDPDTLPMHAALATGAVHQRLIRDGLRCDCNIIVETGTARDSHQFAVLFGVGATAVYPYLAFQVINDLHAQGAIKGDLLQARKYYRRGVRKGLLKVLSKMGISCISSYRGAQLFETVGLSKDITDLCFPGAAGQVGGVGFAELEAEARQVAAEAWQAGKPLSQGGLLKFAWGGEFHAYNPDVVTTLQTAVKSGEKADYQVYADLVNHRAPAALRDLLGLDPARQPIDIDRVETAQDIFPRFDSAGMSIGALSPEAHESLAIAMNTLGGASNSGEGGEDPARFGTLKNSRIKQVASGRFGVTAHYLVNADVLQIKIAQGAKPGEGGQLPGHKVSVEIAALRHAVPGVTLISPPPHHDIYSIEDLAQLIFDLKQVNPKATVSVKLVAERGVGTIAAGVAKAYADFITIAGHDGGTGASPLTSVKYAGSPWETGLPEAHQALVENGLRDRVRLQVDGGFKTGLDVIKGAILGADSFGFGTGPMVALGCKYLRICHLNNCATGVATQDKKLRDEHFLGLPEMVMNYFRFVAEEVREHLAKLGFEKLEDIIGRSDLLVKLEPQTEKQRALNLDRILEAAASAGPQGAGYQGIRNVPHDKGLLNAAILDSLADVIEQGLPARRSFEIKNYDRSVGGALAGAIAMKHGRDGYPGDGIKLTFTGTAGQSFGVWNTHGVHLKLHGDANDYVGKGMSGGSISIGPHSDAVIVGQRSAIVGNTCLYGATGGALFAAGQAGERFAVRNSGATAVVEGVGHHGCEYMTSGTVLVLGRTGSNFAAGMTGGRAYVLDLHDRFRKRVNPESVNVEDLDTSEGSAEMEEVRNLLQLHVDMTGSRWGRRILDDFEHFIFNFRVVRPRGDKEARKQGGETPRVPLKVVG